MVNQELKNWIPTLEILRFKITNISTGWCRCVHIQVHAPGCPVIIVGTHLDLAGGIKKDEMIQELKEKYSDISCYPEISAVYCVSNTDSLRGTIKALRENIYFAATHLCRKGKQKCK